MGKRIISALLWVMMTAAVLALILGICYGEQTHHCFCVLWYRRSPTYGFALYVPAVMPALVFAAFGSYCKCSNHLCWHVPTGQPAKLFELNLEMSRFCSFSGLVQVCGDMWSTQ